MAGVLVKAASGDSTGDSQFENQLFILLPPSPHKKKRLATRNSFGRTRYIFRRKSKLCRVGKILSAPEQSSDLTCFGTEEIVQVTNGRLERCFGNARASLLQEWLLANMNPQLFFYVATIQHSLFSPFIRKETETHTHSCLGNRGMDGWDGCVGNPRFSKKRITVTDKREIRQQHT